MTSVAWRTIGTLRSAPPGLAREGLRRQIFGAALQQAEELARAAEAVGYASKPLPLFYMLSQAGRAIVAAHHPNKAEIRGHGLSFHLDQEEKILTGGLKTPKPPAEGAFQDVACATGSPGLSKRVELGALWRANPDLVDADVPRQHSDEEWWPPLSSNLGQRRLPPEPDEPTTTGGSVGAWLTMPGQTGAEVNAAIERYPSLAGCRALNPGETSAAYVRASETVLRDASTGRVIVSRAAPASLLPRDLWKLEDDLFSCVTVDASAPKWPHPTYVGWVLPSVAESVSPLPLMLWWGLLYGLSSLARYYPAAWSAAIDRDSSTLAEPLREVLDRGADCVPRRIAEALIV
ncbi:hypothetical protein AB0M20_06790 [Actinoplanes sp. NPDC051633]|uniref:YaaC family protein n=1 Tax=Actinoplanes sp. NPDC051633 TaxID=3155670 RepID=UPI00341EEF1B